MSGCQLLKFVAILHDFADFEQSGRHAHMGPTTRRGRGPSQSGFYRKLNGLKPTRTTIRVVTQNKNKKQNSLKMSVNADQNRNLPQISNNSNMEASQNISTVTNVNIDNTNNTNNTLNTAPNSGNSTVNSELNSNRQTVTTSGAAKQGLSNLRTVSETEQSLLSFSLQDMNRENQPPRGGAAGGLGANISVYGIPDLQDINNAKSLDEVKKYKEQLELIQAQNEVRAMREKVLNEHNSLKAWRDVEKYKQVKSGKPQIDSNSTEQIIKEFNELGLYEQANNRNWEDVPRTGAFGGAKPKSKNVKSQVKLGQTQSDIFDNGYRFDLANDPYLLGMKVAKDHVAEQQESDSDVSECEKIMRRKRKLVADAERQARESQRDSRHHDDYSDSDSHSSESDSDYDRRRKSSRSKSKRGKKKSGLNNKARSNRVKHRVYWAQESISLEYVANEPRFSDISIAFLTCGELEALTRKNVSPAEVKSRMHILKKLCYASGNGMSDNNVRELYKSFMSSIEEGRIVWGDTEAIDRLENQVMIRIMQDSQRNDKTKKQTKSFKKKSSDGSETIYWCKDFNKGTCTFTDHHEGLFNGEMTKLWHICRLCFSKTGHKKFHKVSDPTCPLKE